jgi:hypothetical protein
MELFRPPPGYAGKRAKPFRLAQRQWITVVGCAGRETDMAAPKERPGGWRWWGTRWCLGDTSRFLIQIQGAPSARVAYDAFARKRGSPQW